MKKLSVLLVVMMLAFASQAQNIDTTPSVIKSYYFGALASFGAKDIGSENIMKDLGFRAGLTTEISVAQKLIIHNKLVSEPFPGGCGFKTDLRLRYSLTNKIFLSAGYFPTVTRLLQTPNPVSSAGQFLPPSKKIISPDSRMGLMLNSNSLFVGVYADKKDSIEVHAGLDLKFKGTFKRLTISAYHVANHLTFNPEKTELNHKSIYGAALSAAIGRFDLTLFGENCDERTYSGLLNIDLGKNWCSYITTVNIGDEWGHTEVGFLKVRQTTCGKTTVNYLYGAGYQYYPFPCAFGYLQVWLNK